MTGQADAFAALILKRTGLFTDLQLAQVLSADRSDGTGIAGVVTRLGVVREDAFLKKIGEILGFSYTELADVRPTDEAITRLPARAVYQYNVLPLSVENGVMTVATCDPFNTGMTDGVRLSGADDAQPARRDQQGDPQVLRRGRGRHREDDRGRALRGGHRPGLHLEDRRERDRGRGLDREVREPDHRGGRPPGRHGHSRGADGGGAAHPLPHRRHAAQGGRAAPAEPAEGRDHFAHQGHGQPRHRREAPADGRPHRRAPQQRRHRHPRVDDADGVRRVDLAAPAAEGRQLRQNPGPRVQSARLRPGREADQPAERNLSGDGADRLGQIDVALRLSARDQQDGGAHPDGRGPDRIRDGRHQPGAGAPGHRAHLRARAARLSAPRPRHHHGGRNPRRRNGGNRDQRVADRPLGVQHAAHQRRGRRVRPPDRYGRRAFPGGVGRGGRDGPAPGAPALPRLSARLRASAGVSRH